MKLMVCAHKQYMIQENNRLFRKPPLHGPPLSLPDTTGRPRRRPVRRRENMVGVNMVLAECHQIQIRLL